MNDKTEGEAGAVSDEEQTEMDDEGGAVSEQKSRETDDEPEEEDGTERKLERRLEERELGLDRRSEKLDAREQRLDEREQQLDGREEELAERRRELEQWDESLEERAEELDDREANIEKAEEELSERARELNEHEETLQNYIEGQVEDLETNVQETVWSALDRYEENRGTGRFGPTGTLLIGLAGLSLAVAGAGYAAAVGLEASVVLFDATVPNAAIAAVLLVVGLAANLLTVTDRL